MKKTDVSRSNEKPIVTRMTIDMIRELDAIATKSRRSRTQTILCALDEYIANQNPITDPIEEPEVRVVNRDGVCIECEAGQHEHCMHSRRDGKGYVSCKCFVARHKMVGA